MDWKTATIEDIPMRWQEQGDGRPLVLVHGLPTSPRVWRHVMPRVAARCLAWEMVGYGGSIPHGQGRDISLARQADYLLRWLKAIGVDRAVLAGHGLGGGVVQIAVVRRPEACSGLLLADSISYDSRPAPSIELMRAMGGLVEHLPNRLFKGIFSAFIRRGHDNAGRAAESIEEHWRYYAAHDAAAAFVRQIRALDMRDMRPVADRLRSLRLLTRLVWGASDRFQKLRYGERFARELQAPFRRIPGARHFTPEDHPGIVAEEISHLLSEVEAAETPADAQPI